MRSNALLVAVAIALVACEGGDVIVADQRAIGSGAAGGSAGAPPIEGACAGPEDCAVNELCAGACGAATGVCELRPITCAPEPNTVCGCDGVNYWNDCFRRQAGARLASAGECVKSAAKCGRPMDPPCPNGGACARVLPPFAACVDEVPGTCWLTPPMCPKEEPAARVFVPCTSMGPGPSAMCLNACEAIRSGAIVRRSPGPGPCMP